MTVRARFYIGQITRHAYNPAQGQVKLQAVTRGTENKTWAAATPTGTLDMTIGNPAALEFFNDNLGKELTLTFELDPLTCTDCARETTANAYGTDQLGGYTVDQHSVGNVPGLNVGDHVCNDCAKIRYDNR
jgi:hypothetical protein